MKKFVSIFLIFYIIFLSVSPVFAYEPKQVIRVAKFNSGNYFISEDDGTVKSYDKEYLDKISEYTGMLPALSYGFFPSGPISHC